MKKNGLKCHKFMKTFMHREAAVNRNATRRARSRQPRGQRKGYPACNAVVARRRIFRNATIVKLPYATAAAACGRQAMICCVVRASHRASLSPHVRISCVCVCNGFEVDLCSDGRAEGVHEAGAYSELLGPRAAHLPPKDANF